MSREEDKVSKERSSLYPAFSVNECLELVDEIKRIGGKKASIATVANTLNVSVTTNSFRAKISAAKQFGLIKGTGSTVELSDTAKKIIYAVDGVGTSRLLVEVFKTAPLYQKLAERYDNQAVPPADKLSNLLLLEYGITKTAKDIAATKFIESAEQVGVLQNGVLVVDPEELPNVKSGADLLANQGAPSGNSPDQMSSRSLIPEQPEYHFAIPTLSGAVAQIIIPKEVGDKDLDFISMYLQNMLPTFIANLKERLKEQEQTTRE